jgi:hypothetical protein
MSELTNIESKILAAFAKAASAKAMGTEAGEHDADVALAVAQRLAAKHSIDLEVLRQKNRAAGKKVSEPVRETLYLTKGPYQRFRCDLASRVATAMGLSTRLAFDASYVIYLGFPEDIAMAWQVFQLVEPQMLASAERRVKAGEHRRVVDYTTRNGTMSAKTFKANYFEGYISRIVNRIFTARTEAEESVVFAEGIKQDDGRVTGRVTGALVLVSRKAEVEKLEQKLYPVEKYKNGKEKKPKYWKAPTAIRGNARVQRTGAEDAKTARIRTDSELKNRTAIDA